ncbi:MAG: hypothetical protein EHM52_04160, partial [Actinomycetota bacterium]
MRSGQPTTTSVTAWSKTSPRPPRRSMRPPIDRRLGEGRTAAASSGRRRRSRIIVRERRGSPAPARRPKASRRDSVPRFTPCTPCVVLLALLCVGVAGCADSGAPPADRPATPAAGSPPATESSGSTIAATLDERGLATMALIVRAAGLERRLSGAGPYTLVAPDEEAFGAVAPRELARTLARRDRAEAFVLDHLLAGRVPPEALSDCLQTL